MRFAAIIVALLFGWPQVVEAQDDLEALAEGGSASAQNLFGLRHYEGDGVPQDDTEAAKWYRKAAEQGDVIAQSMLGINYFLGQGVPQNYTEGYVWLSIAAASEASDEAAIEGRDRAAKQLSPAD